MTDYDVLYAQQAAVCGAPFPEFVRAFDALPPRQTVLDLGCGQGRDALMAARRGHRVVGVDRAPTGVRQMCEAAEAEGLSIVGVVADMTAFEPEGRFDVVLLDRVLHMLPSHDARRAVLARMTAAVELNGHLLIADTPRNLPMIRGFMADQEPTWRSTYAKKGFLFWQRTSPSGGVTP